MPRLELEVGGRLRPELIRDSGLGLGAGVRSRIWAMAVAWQKHSKGLDWGLDLD